MYFIQCNDGRMFTSGNPPTDEIACFFGANYGPDCRGVSSASMADHQAELALLHAGTQAPPAENGTPGEFVSAGNTVTLTPGTLEIVARDATGATLQTWEGVLVYPLPVVEPPAPVVLPPVDLADLVARAKAIRLTVDVLARTLNIADGTPLTNDVAQALLAELVRQEALAHLPRIGDFS